MQNIKVKKRIEDIVDELRDLRMNLESKYTEKGSIKIGLEGYPEDFHKLQELFKSGQLNKILGIPVEDISLINAENSDHEAIKNHKKVRLVEEIRTQGAKGQDLSDADLRGADLAA